MNLRTCFFPGGVLIFVERLKIKNKQLFVSEIVVELFYQI